MLFSNKLWWRGSDKLGEMQYREGKQGEDKRRRGEERGERGEDKSRRRGEEKQALGEQGRVESG